MSQQIKFYEVIEGISEGTIISFKVKVGDTVQEGDSIVSIETDKVEVEIPSPQTGVITTIFAKDGQVVKLGDLLVEIK
ncbi:biotin/lipoyl-containing protein [Candidatus Phytoplasma phoenicium]|uniref:Dihydrolipoamide acetyltransferase component of pyruvate dehydrogenase complex n=1 Tax=Candidatus Phytoplasma phoenicium TaxID=198422 RepID=A0A0L0ML08_9MOLU|nr:biotin/lipoyl-containing protein [Candidatus Phytoplasma phoenicium]KND62674.1 Dihydrolipoamide acetyltransferase component of pyruvate dehydrogenase complex [Candidatus Phytoplasma phoenicium]